MGQKLAAIVEPNSIWLSNVQHVSPQDVSPTAILSLVVMPPLYPYIHMLLLILESAMTAEGELQLLTHDLAL